MENLSALLKSGCGLGEKAWSLLPSKSVLSTLAIAAVSGAALFAIGQRVYINVRTKRVVHKDSDPKHLFVLVPGYLGSPSQMQSSRPPPPQPLTSSAFLPTLAHHLSRASFVHFISSDTSRLASVNATNASR
jgi:hypothetical protein